VAEALRSRVEELTARLTKLEGTCRDLERDRSDLKQRLAEEREDRAALEERVKGRLDDAGEDMAQEAVAGWEAKYNRLKARYRVSGCRGLLVGLFQACCSALKGS